MIGELSRGGVSPGVPTGVSFTVGTTGASGTGGTAGTGGTSGVTGAGGRTIDSVTTGVDGATGGISDESRGVGTTGAGVITSGVETVMNSPEEAGAGVDVPNEAPSDTGTPHDDISPRLFRDMRNTMSHQSTKSQTTPESINIISLDRGSHPL